MNTMLPRAAALCLTLALAACGDDDEGTNPTPDDVAGSYTASTFTLTTEGVPLDLLALGATVTADLEADGTTTGRLFVPDIGQGAALDEDLTGTWTLTENTVTFSQSNSTVIQDVDFAVGSNSLTGEGTYQGAILLLVLTREE